MYMSQGSIENNIFSFYVKKVELKYVCILPSPAPLMRLYWIYYYYMYI